MIFFVILSAEQRVDERGVGSRQGYSIIECAIQEHPAAVLKKLLVFSCEALGTRR